MLFADQLNTYDVMASDHVVFTEGALEDFVAGATLAAVKAPSQSTTEAAHVAAKAEEKTAPEAVEAPYGEGSALPLDGGKAPEGFTIKGNSNSMKYHTEESPWYGRTKAEVWFATPEAAEAAGFVNAVRPADEEEAK